LAVVGIVASIQIFGERDWSKDSRIAEPNCYSASSRRLSGILQESHQSPDSGATIQRPVGMSRPEQCKRPAVVIVAGIWAVVAGEIHWLAQNGGFEPNIRLHKRRNRCRMSGE
jgi:hypothetical protein